MSKLIDIWDILRDDIKDKELDQVMNPFICNNKTNTGIPSSSGLSAVEEPHPPLNSWWVKNDNPNYVARLSLNEQRLLLEYISLPVRDHDDDVVMNYPLTEITIQNDDGKKKLISSSGRVIQVFV